MFFEKTLCCLNLKTVLLRRCFCIFQDSEAYTYLLHQIAPKDSGVGLGPMMVRDLYYLTCAGNNPQSLSDAVLYG